MASTLPGNPSPVEKRTQTRLPTSRRLTRVSNSGAAPRPRVVRDDMSTGLKSLVGTFFLKPAHIETYSTSEADRVDDSTLTMVPPSSFAKSPAKKTPGTRTGASSSSSKSESSSSFGSAQRNSETWDAIAPSKQRRRLRSATRTVTA